MSLTKDLLNEGGSKLIGQLGSRLIDQVFSNSMTDFRYLVDIDGEPQAAFAACILPTLEYDTVSITEGGEHRYRHIIRMGRKEAKLVLRSGIVRNKILDWYMDAHNDIVSRHSISVRILNDAAKPVLTMYVQDALPVKWGLPQLSANANKISLVEWELFCGPITFEQS